MASKNAQLGQAFEVVFEKRPLLLFGLDLNGFSRFTDAMITAHGSGAAETLTDLLNSLFTETLAVLKSHGFEFGDYLGDGFVAMRGLADLEEQYADLSALASIGFDLEQRIERRGLGLSARTGWAQGHASLYSIKGQPFGREQILLGEAVHRLHETLSAKRAGRSGSNRQSSPPEVPIRSEIFSRANALSTILPALPRRDQAKMIRSKLAHSEIRDLTILFCRLAPSVQCDSIQSDQINLALKLIRSLADAAGGRLEKVSHDDKGLIARLTFGEISARGYDAAYECGQDLCKYLTGMDLTPAAALSAGPIYRGPIDFGSFHAMTIHGAPVNRAAKLVADTMSGVSIDNKLHWFQVLPETGAIYPDPGGFRKIGLVAEDDSREYADDGLTPPAQGKLFLGRHHELQVLRTKISRLNPHYAEIVLLEGEPGIGKTSLIDRLKADLNFEGDIVQCAGVPARVVEPFDLWAECLSTLVQAWCGRNGGVPDALIPSLDILSSEEKAVLSDFLKLSPQGRRRSETLSPDARQAILEKAIISFLSWFLVERPLLLILDDLQWFDGQSLNLLSRVGRTQGRLAIVAAARTQQPALENLIQHMTEQLSCTYLRLEEMGPHQIADIIDKLDLDHRLTPAQSTLISTISGGNPFFAIHLAHEFDEGDLQTDDISDVPDIGRSIFSILSMRLERLSQTDALAVRVLAIADRPLAIKDTETVLSRTGIHTDLSTALPRLAAKSFLRIVRADGEDAYTLQNRILTDTVLTQQSEFTQALLHHCVARFLTVLRRAKDEQSVRSSELARHWQLAGATGRAAVLYETAATAALNIGAYDSAWNLYDCAENTYVPAITARSMRRFARWLAYRAEAKWGMGDIASAHLDTKRCIDAIDHYMSQSCVGNPVCRIHVAKLRRGALPLVPASFLRFPTEIKDTLAAVSIIRAEIGQFRGDLPSIINGNVTAVALSKDPTVRDIARSRGFGFLGYLFGLLRLTPLARYFFSIGNRYQTAGLMGRPQSYTLGAEAVWHLAFGRWAIAEKRLTAAQELAKDPDQPHLLDVLETLFALSAQYQGDWQKAHAIFKRLLDRATTKGNRLHQAWALYGQAQALLNPGEAEDALEAIERAKRLLFDRSDRQSILICHGLAAKAYLQLRDYPAACKEAQNALALGQTVSMTNFSSLEGFAAPADVGLCLALSVPADDRGDDLHALIKDGMSMLARYSVLFPIARPRYLLCKGFLSRMNGRARKAERQLSRGLRIANALNMRHEQTRLRHALEGHHL